MKKLLIFTILFLFSVSQVLAEKAPDPAQVELGKKLYMDTRLSLANDISCNTCHDLANYGVDSKPTSPGHKGQLGDRNSPTVYNASRHFLQFWDGRAKDVEEQALGPVLNPVEMAMPSEEEVVKRLKADANYVKMFQAAFPNEKDPLTFVNMGKAIGAFERTLITESRFDKWRAGDKNALTEAEQAGFKTFMSSGCPTCHMEPLFGGTMFQKLGLVKPYETEDTGRHKVTGKEVDKYMFKVPSLLNIEKTGPYFHDGSIETLEEAVKIMGEYQLGKKLTDEEVTSIVTFLNSLTGELPKEFAKSE